MPTAGKRQPSEFFVFEEPLEDGTPHTQTTVFAASADMDVELLIERLRKHHLTHNPPEQIDLIASEPRSEALLRLTSDSRLKESLPQITRYVDTPPVRAAVFDEKGTLRFVDGEPGSVPEHRREKLLRRGLMTIFREHYGMLDAGPGFHYVNPSERHTRAFIRAGSVLLRSAEISFIAMGLLPWWPAGTRRVFTDTASINAVAYALADLCGQFDRDFIAPTIDSFSSYEGIETFDFDEKEAFCIVSASTSGNLVEKMTSRGFITMDRVATLFYCGDEVPNQQILCDLTKRPPDQNDGWDKFESYSGGEACDLCRRGVATIRISGDEFLPATPQVEAIVITQDHEPKWLAATLDDLIGVEAIRCHADYSGDAAKARELFIHLPNVLSEESESPLRGRLATRLHSAVPASLERIVAIDDASSMALARVVATHYEQRMGKSADALVVSDTEVRDQRIDLAPGGGSVTVVAGAVSSGRALLSVSQFMRVENLGHLSYVIGVGRLPSATAWDRLRQNLTYGEDAGEYPLLATRVCYLPDESSSDGSPWALEQRYLMALRDRLDAAEDDWSAAIEVLETRHALIEKAVDDAAPGLVDQLFLPSIREGELHVADTTARLQLRPGFVFWRAVNRETNPNPEQKATQAEVYLTMAAVLHQLRQPQPNGRALVQHAHNRTVLSPANFSRYNDGVIQACLLRAAHPSELDYSHSKSLSAQMRDIVLRFLDQRAEREGEAFPEFLMALARGRTTLHREHRAEVVDELERCDLPPLLEACAADYRQHLAR